MDFLGILFGIILLSQGGDLLTKSSVDISLKLSIPKIIIGMTIVSFATSAPELIVSLNATLNGLPNFAIGNVLGSNIANIGLVLGIITIIYPITLKQRFYNTDFPLLLISTGLFYYIIYTGNQISRNEGFVIPKNKRVRIFNGGDKELRIIEILRPAFKDNLVQKFTSFE